MNARANFFIHAILPNIPQLNIFDLQNSRIEHCSLEAHQTEQSLEVLNANEESHPNSQELVLDENKPILVILDSQSDQGISEQSGQLMEKILLSMQLKQTDFQYLSTWEKKLTQDALCAALTTSKIRIIFLIGTLTMQHFLGKDKKISQTQGQVFDYSYQDSTFYFIPLYHPDFVALNSSIKNITWNSVKNLIPWLKQHLA